jgi:AcrR family transcriptional regulator
VADALGVDPKALNYHVGDREGLRQLVALDVFEAELGGVVIPAGGDWREAVRSYVLAFRAAIIKLGVLAESLHLPGPQGLGTLEPVERVLQALVDGGLDVDTAGRTMTLLTDMAYAAARDELRSADNPVHPDVPGITTALKSAADNEFPVLRQVVAACVESVPDTGQLEFNLSLVIAGLEQIASKRRRKH